MEVWLTFLAGPDSGKSRKALYKLELDAPETRQVVVAMGDAASSMAAAAAPVSFDAAMATGQVYLVGPSARRTLPACPALLTP